MVLLSLSTLSYHRHTPAPGCAKRKVTRSARGYMSFARSMSTAELRDFASELADAAAEVIKPFFRSKLLVDTKADESPVTQADRAAEQAMRKLISQRYPYHEILGEEFGLSQEVRPKDESQSGYRWVLDPIDGTRAFITGKPTFGTLIALLHNGVPIIGIINQPISKEQWIGVAGEQTTLNA